MSDRSQEAKASNELLAVLAPSMICLWIEPFVEKCASVFVSTRMVLIAELFTINDIFYILCMYVYY